MRHSLILLILLCSGCCKESELSSAKRAIYSSDHRQKTEALQVLAQCGERAAPVVGRIAALMYDQNVGVASAAAYALRKIDTTEARQALKNAEDARARRRAGR